MKTIYFIGGSPCSGKSTVAEALSRKYGFYYFKVDDNLEQYTQQGAARNYPICKKQLEMTSEQIWMRNPLIQCDEELQYYEEIFEFIMNDLYRINKNAAILTEGAAYLPHIMKNLHIPKDRYLSITPTSDFQIAHYRERDWIPYVLQGCSDKEKAFDNWMNRDCMFAEHVRKECTELKYHSILNDGTITLADMIHSVAVNFALDS